MADLSAPFVRATTALSLLAIDPAGLGGIVLRARSGPVRDAVVAMFSALPLPLTRLHPGVSDEALFGGLDLSATLTAGRIVRGKGDTVTLTYTRDLQHSPITARVFDVRHQYVVEIGDAHRLGLIRACNHFAARRLYASLMRKAREPRDRRKA